MRLVGDDDRPLKMVELDCSGKVAWLTNGIVGAI